MYPDPTKTFLVYPDASSKFAIDAVFVQDGKVILIFSRKFNDTQLKYTVKDQEQLAIFLRIANTSNKSFTVATSLCTLIIKTSPSAQPNGLMLMLREF